MRKSLESPQAIRSIFPKSKINVGKKIYSSLEFTNYKPLSTLDLPIEDEENEEQFTKDHRNSDNCVLGNHKVVSKLTINKKYIDELLKDCISLKIESIIDKLIPTINLTFRKKFQLFVDLDDTLIYTSKIQINSDDLELEGGNFVCLRPFASLFLSTLCKYFDIIIYSSARKSYISSILKKIDPKGKYINSILSFDDCISYQGIVLKPLQRVKGLVKGNYILVDDNIANVLINKGHSILISPYIGNSEDSELLKLLNFLQEQKESSDITKDIEQLY